MIRFENVRKSFGSRAILRGVNLHVEQGQTFVILGPSGTGKSVTLKHIAGLLYPDSGRVIVDGQNVPELKPAELKELRGHFGILFQNGALLQWMNVADNVALPLREHTTLPEAEIQKRVQHALTLVNMQHDGAKFPSNISGGMQKRAGLARAIIRQPKIVLYDEPTSGLDPIMSNQINELVLDMQAKLGITSVVVTHDMESAYMIADQIAVIYKGEIIQTGTPDEIRNTKDPRVKQFITGSTRGPMTDSPEGMTSGKAVGAQ